MCQKASQEATGRVDVVVEERQGPGPRLRSEAASPPWTGEGAAGCTGLLSLCKEPRGAAPEHARAGAGVRFHVKQGAGWAAFAGSWLSGDRHTER